MDGERRERAVDATTRNGAEGAESRRRDAITESMDAALAAVGGRHVRLYLAGEQGLRAAAARDDRGQDLAADDREAAACAGSALRRGVAMATLDVHLGPDRVIGPGDTWLWTVMCALIRRHDRVLGVLWVGGDCESRPVEYHAADLALLTTFANRLAAVLDDDGVRT